LRQVVEIVIGGVPTILEVCFMYLFMSLSRILLPGSIWTDLLNLMRHQVDLRNVEFNFQLLRNIYLVADIILPGILFSPLLGQHLRISIFCSSTFHFFTSSILRALAWAFTLLPAHPSMKTSGKV
jgi:hypothetical protein